MRRRVLMVQPTLQPPGGGNGVAAWTLEALKDDHELGIITWTPIDLDAVNRFYGTALRRSDLHESVVSPVVTWGPDRAPFPLALLKDALLMRAARALTREWDVLLTVNNEMDFGRRGIQYVHYPIYRRPRPRDDVRWYHGPAIVRDAYYGLADRVGQVSMERLRNNLTLVNSDWTGRLVRSQHGRPTITEYPPVHGQFAEVPWNDRVDGFLCIGRIAPEKQLHRVIDIVAGVRRHHPGTSLRIVGTIGKGRYCRELLKRVRAESAWVTIDHDLSREELLTLIPRYRYGIHGMLEEHFGMAPAEMVAAGCIVFVPRGGGQVEIVGDDPRLTYPSVEHAVETIVHVLDHPDVQADLRALLARRRELFSVERFVTAIRELVRTFPPPA